MPPLSYLTLLRTSPKSSAPTPSHIPELDVPWDFLRLQLSAQPQTPGITTACLRICEVNKPRPASAHGSTTTGTRPMFNLDPSMSQFEHSFPVPTGQGATQETPALPRTVWILDFTHDEKTKGIVMSQSRMREIEGIVNPFSHSSMQNPMGMVGRSPFGSGSWIDLVVCVLHVLLLLLADYNTVKSYQSNISGEIYLPLCALRSLPSDASLNGFVQTSTTSSYPELNLRLNAPQEPGFFLQRVQVQNMKELWSILEVQDCDLLQHKT